MGYNGRKSLGYSGVSNSYQQGKSPYLIETEAYKARVVADGGTVISLPAVDRAIRKAKAGGVYDSISLWVSSKFGIKKNGSNVASKLYDLKGNDVILYGNPVWSANISSFTGEPGISLVSANSQYMKSSANIDLTGIHKTTFSFLMSGFVKPASGIQSIIERSENGAGYWAYTFYNDSALNSTLFAAGGVTNNSMTIFCNIGNPYVWTGVLDKTIAADQAKIYRNGVLGTRYQTGSGNTEDFGNSKMYFGSRAGTSLFLDGVFHELILFNDAMNAATASGLVNVSWNAYKDSYLTASPKYFSVVGDSKSMIDGVSAGWGPYMQSVNIPSPSQRWLLRDVYANNGYTVKNIRDAIDAWLAAASGAPDVLLMDAGVNDQVSMPTKAAWEEDYQYILDALHTKWPTVPIYMAKPWYRTGDTNANTMSGWIDELLASNPSFTHLGHDERIWLKGSDNGATMTVDGTHYSVQGCREIARQWGTVIQGF